MIKYLLIYLTLMQLVIYVFSLLHLSTQVVIKSKNTLKLDTYQNLSNNWTIELVFLFL